MSKKIRLIILSMFLSMSYVSIAQQVHTSPFSFIGIGDISNSGLAYNRSLGGLGIGVRSSYYLNNLNPASLSAMDTMSVTFEFGASGLYNVLKTSTLEEPTLNGNIDYMAIGFPITSWLKTSVGFMPFSKVGYNLIEYVDIEDDSDPYQIRRTLNGEGGLNSFYLSNSIQLLDHWSLGFTATYLFGNISNEILDEPTSNEILVKSASKFLEVNTTEVNDFAYSLGLQYHKKINGKYNLTVGAVYGIQNKLKSESDFRRTSLAYNNPVDTLSLINGLEHDLDLPSYFGFGFSIGTEKLLFGMDYKYTMWSQSNLLDKNESLLDAQKLVSAIEYIPKPRTATKYIHRMRYRLGANYEQTYMKINNEQLKEVGITFGVGLPMKRSKSTLNLSFDIAKRATFKSDILTQTYFKFKMDISLHDIWFIKRKYD